MSKRKTIKMVMDGKVAFRLEISGSDDIVDTLTKDTFFNKAVRDAAESLIGWGVKQTKELKITGTIHDTSDQSGGSDE